jgi:hypothetical protein
MFDAAGIDVGVLRQTSRRAIETNANRQAIADLKKVSVNGKQPFAKLDTIFVVDSAKPEIELDGGTIPNTPLNQILLKHRNTIEAVKQSGRNPAETQRLTQTARLRLAYQLWHQEQKQAATKAAETVTIAKNAEKIVSDRATLQTKRGLNASTTAAANSGGTSQPPASYAKQIAKSRGRLFSDL